MTLPNRLSLSLRAGLLCSPALHFEGLLDLLLSSQPSQFLNGVPRSSQFGFVSQSPNWEFVFLQALNGKSHLTLILTQTKLFSEELHCPEDF